MPIPRRSLMTILGGIILGYGTASAVGAFDEIELEREIDVDVATDADGLLSITENPKTDTSVVVDPGENGQVTIGLADGTALNPGATTNIHRAIQLYNHGTTNLVAELVGVTDSGTSDTIVGYDAADPSVQTLTIPSEGKREVGLQFDLESHSNLDHIEAIRITAHPE